MPITACIHFIPFLDEICMMLKSCSVSATSVRRCLPSAAFIFNWWQFSIVSFVQFFWLTFSQYMSVLVCSIVSSAVNLYLPDIIIHYPLRYNRLWKTFSLCHYVLLQLHNSPQYNSCQLWHNLHTGLLMMHSSILIAIPVYCIANFKFWGICHIYLYNDSKIFIISAGVTTIGFLGKCFLLPVTR